MFCCRTLIFVKEGFVALGVAVVLATSDQFFNFLLLSYGCFSERSLFDALKSLLKQPGETNFHENLCA